MSQFTEICSALSVEARVKILAMLKNNRRLCVNALTCRLGISQSAVSQHLRILKSAGLVKAEKIGYWVHYSVNPKILKNFNASIRKLTSNAKK
ncbi:MAG TPA: metalloregulator ArsR/SmtB family transcription factor [Planctomycetota bacterium]|nr:metalloregulator ArsR/SmtB family transcription factor [Planctomycetota bacterium]